MSFRLLFTYIAWIILACATIPWHARAQTTQGLISGVIRDADTAQPIVAAAVTCTNLLTLRQIGVRTDKSGFYLLLSLSPGTYRIAVVKSEYQSRTVYSLALRVAGFLTIDFDLHSLHSIAESIVHKSFVLSNQSVLSYLGPDFDASYSGAFDPEPAQTGQLEPSLSGVVEPALIADLPLAGRDIYTALALMPGVTTDIATGRSLGLSSGGQRPTSSNFLLDGLEYNDHLVGGPVSALVPEGILEYRISTNNFSAEYGRTSGQIANAVTTPGGNHWHAQLFSGIRNEAFNANSFQNNANDVPIGRQRQVEFGATAGGPLLPGRLFQSLAFEDLRSDGLADPYQAALPEPSFISSLPQGGNAALIFKEHPLLIPLQPASTDFVSVTLRPTVTYRRLSGISRTDAILSPKHRILLRAAAGGVQRPDFITTPYGNARIASSSMSAGVVLESSWSTRTATEVRGGFTQTALAWGDPLKDLPDLSIAGTSILLPGAANKFGFDDHSKVFELGGSIVHGGSRNTLKAGADFSSRSAAFSLERKTDISFDDVSSFKTDTPLSFLGSASRIAHAQGVNRIPLGQGRFTYSDSSGYVQDDFRLSPQFTVYAGLRFDSFGAPRSSSEETSFLVPLASQTGIPSAIASAKPVNQTGGDLLSMDRANWGLRAGFALSLDRAGRTVLRGGYGRFYDRLADSVWTDLAFNDFVSVSGQLPGTLNYLQPVSQIYSALPLLNVSPFFNVTAFAPHLATPHVDSAFLGQQFLVGKWFFEVNGVSSYSRELLSNDIVNRQASPFQRLRPNSIINEDINYRANQDYSGYSALVMRSQYRGARALLDVSYTWSHSIDNQSDPLLGDFFDLSFANQTDRSSMGNYYSGFSTQYDRNSDRGSSDFDQRHNLTAFGRWSLPGKGVLGWRGALLHNWSVAGIFAIRSGLPYTVYLGGNCQPVCNTRPNLVGTPLLASPVPAGNGQTILNRSAFSIPAAFKNGDLGRNTFSGRIFYNLDLSLARSWRVRERSRISLRADFFNALNHANWNNPQSFLGESDFGVSVKGRVEVPGFPALTPFNEIARQIELRLRVEF